MPFLKIKMFSCLSISQYFHLCNCLLEIGTLEKKAWESSPLLCIWCYFSFSGFLRIGRTLFQRDSWFWSPIIGTSLSTLSQELTEILPNIQHLAGLTQQVCVRPEGRPRLKPQVALCPRCSTELTQLWPCWWEGKLALAAAWWGCLCRETKPQQAGSHPHGDFHKACHVARSQLDTHYMVWFLVYGNAFQLGQLCLLLSPHCVEGHGGVAHV